MSGILTGAAGLAGFTVTRRMPFLAVAGAGFLLIAAGVAVRRGRRHTRGTHTRPR